LEIWDTETCVRCGCQGCSLTDWNCNRWTSVNRFCWAVNVEVTNSLNRTVTGDESGSKLQSMGCRHRRSPTYRIRSRV